MKRYIDADGLANVKFVAIKGGKTEEAYRTGWNGAIECIIENAPTADVVEVVRCKDCRHGQYDATHYFCSEHYHKVYADDFCSHGEIQCNYFGERKEV